MLNVSLPPSYPTYSRSIRVFSIILRGRTLFFTLSSLQWQSLPYRLRILCMYNEESITFSSSGLPICIFKHTSFSLEGLNAKLQSLFSVVMHGTKKFTKYYTYKIVICFWNGNTNSELAMISRLSFHPPATSRIWRFGHKITFSLW